MYLHASGACPRGDCPGSLKAAHCTGLHHNCSHAIAGPHIRQRSSPSLHLQEH